MLMESVDVQMFRCAWFFRQLRQRRRLVHAILGHVPVCGPLAAGDGEQTRPIDVNRMVARKPRSVPPRTGFHQRPDTRKHAKHIAAAGGLVQILRRGGENEFDLLLHRHRFQRDLGDGSIGSANQRVLMPRNRKHHAAIAGVRNHNGAIARQKGSVQHQVNALARRDHRDSIGFGHPPHCIAERAGRIDHHLRPHREGFARFQIHRGHTIQKSVSVLREPNYLRVIQKRGALLCRRRHQVDQQSSIVELTVVVNHAAAQAFGLDCGQPCQRLVPR